MTLGGTWINVHQNKSDRIVGMVARKMKRSKHVVYYNMNLQGVNKIVVKGIKHKDKVYFLDHIQKFCPYPVSYFLDGNRMYCTNNSAVAMD